MRLPSLDRDFWQLRSGEEAHRRNPDGFWIPDREVRVGLRRGQAARLIFEIEGYEPDGRVSIQGERMWVIVVEAVDDKFVGILDNQPACLDRADDVYLRFGAEIPFAAEHVIDVADPPSDYVEWQLSQEPERRWPRT